MKMEKKLKYVESRKVSCQIQQQKEVRKMGMSAP